MEQRCSNVGSLIKVREVGAGNCLVPIGRTTSRLAYGYRCSKSNQAEIYKAEGVTMCRRSNTRTPRQHTTGKQGCEWNSQRERAAAGTPGGRAWGADEGCLGGGCPAGSRGATYLAQASRRPVPHTRQKHARNNNKSLSQNTYMCVKNGVYVNVYQIDILTAR